MKYADLHLHSTASDGLVYPKEVIKTAKKSGFSAVSLTDHDSISGLDEAIHWGEKLGVEVIPGIELSTLYNDKEVHILGYYIDWQDRLFQQNLEYFIDVRKNRADKIIEKLNEMNINIQKERVYKIAGTSFVGRPHIARALLEKGYINSINEAFTKEYIAKGGKAYVERDKLDPEGAIKMIKDVGGIPILAHPGMFGNEDYKIDERLIIEFKKLGLMGIEVYCPNHDEKLTKYYKMIADKHNLLITGGSDYHGDLYEGMSIGSIKLPYKYVEKLKNKTIENL